MSKAEQIKNVIAKFRNSFDVSEENVFNERSTMFCFSKSCLHGLSVAFYVLAIIVVLCYSISRYSSLSEGSSSSLRLPLNTKLLLNDENLVRDKL